MTGMPLQFLSDFNFSRRELKLFQQWFNDLYRDRLENARILDKPSMSGVKNNVSDKYTDQAHFIYELLQNADDTEATRAEFELFDDKLIFKHNGKRHFSISNPANEKADRNAGKLGDINAITSIGNSTKGISPATIGKFGVGFKAVFQYTKTPEIWDKNFSFKIVDFIVPESLFGKCPYEKNIEETLFVFPFDKETKPKIQAFQEIQNKLKSLSFPLLFLSHLQELNFKISSFKGFYRKNIVSSSNRRDNIVEEKIKLLENQNGTLKELNFLFFSRQINVGRYSIGYFMERERLRPIVRPAFCFFPTKEYTGLNFLIHAPFLLTDSREGIFQGKPHNVSLIENLANLVADSLPILRDKNLIDDNILDIIPVVENSENIFSSFYRTVKIVMKTQELIPVFDVTNGKYSFVKSKNAYWAEVRRLTEIFSNQQLADIVQNPNARWVFVSKPREKTDSRITKYIDEITKTFLNEEVLLKGRNDPYSRQIGTTIRGITPTFIEKQSFEWLHKFYKWLSETSARTNAAKTLPLFLDTKKNAVAAITNNLPTLFLPMVGGSDYPTVHPDLFANSNTKNFLINQIGIKSPSLRDEIENKIFPQYDKFHERIKEDDKNYFKKVFAYYRQLYMQLPNGKLEEYISKLKEHLWLRCVSVNPSNFARYSRPKYLSGGSEHVLYISSEELKKYFTAAGCGRFVDFNFYLSLIDRNRENELIKFFLDIGLAREVQYVRVPIDLGENQRKKYGLPKERSTREEFWYEYRIEGAHELLKQIADTNKSSDAFKKSLILWKRLVAVNQVGKLCDKMRGIYEYFNRKSRSQEFNPIIAQELCTKSWLFNKSGNSKSATNINVAEMNKEYDVTSDSAREVIKFLSIEEKPTSNLSAAEKELIKFGEMVKKALAEGLSLDEIKKRLKKINVPPPGTKPPIEKPKRPTRPLGKIQGDINESESEETKANNSDRDNWTPQTVDYKKKLENLKRKTELEEEKLIQLENWQQQAANAEKYSYSWFKACLELEILNSNENNASSKEVSISFGRVEKEPNTPRTLILKYPSRFIPQFMEDLENIPLNLKTDKDSTKVEIEVISVKHNILRVKLKNGADIANINLSEVREATINAQNPVFILEELKKQFQNLGYDDSYNLRENLCENIEFIFGPPGTGKTTHLASKIILPLMKELQSKKILVLTPTNKAADVLTKKIMSITNNFDWLIRFGTTDDESIEQKVFREKTFDIRTKPRRVVITTIARFPYDFFMVDGKRFCLHDLDWDYIIIDEASMIPLINIILPLYLKKPKKFIIAGDPFQIEPVISLDFWKGENIYTLVNLNSFVASQTVPHNYKVTKLTT